MLNAFIIILVNMIAVALIVEMIRDGWDRRK